MGVLFFGLNDVFVVGEYMSVLLFVVMVLVGFVNVMVIIIVFVVRMVVMVCWCCMWFVGWLVVERDFMIMSVFVDGLY